MRNSDHSLENNCKRLRLESSLSNSLVSVVNKPKPTISASIHIKTFGIPLISKATGSSVDLIRLQPSEFYTVGRDRRRCDFSFDHRQVSKEHCQIYFDAYSKKVFVVDGVLFSRSNECSRVRVSLNGVYVDGARVGNGEIKEVGASSEVSFVCANEGMCSGVRIGFAVERIVFMEEVIHGDRSNSKNSLFSEKCSVKLGDSKLANAGLLSSKCREKLSSDDHVLHIRECFNNPRKFRSKHSCRNRVKSNSCFTPVCVAHEIHSCEGLNTNDNETTCLSNEQHLHPDASCRNSFIATEPNIELQNCNINGGHLQQSVYARVPIGECTSYNKPSDIYTDQEKNIQSDQIFEKKRGVCAPPPPPGNKFYLNRLHFMGDDQFSETNVTLPELLNPVETLECIFIATFTSDLSWFLSYCEIPSHLPISVACHNSERCWSSSPDKRTLKPYSDFPNLVVIYPQFPEVISFSKDRKKIGIACHHPKLFVLQRHNSIRVIITSANLVAKQWLRVTNTVWWQDFPHGIVPDYTSLFAQVNNEEINQDSRSDFAAQLAGFMATLLVGAPEQAHWIFELSKFDFSNASGHLVASVPGIHTPKHPYISESLGSIEASVVGISHLYRTSADSNGKLLKKLASALQKRHVSAYEMVEVILRRNINIAADSNAVSVAVSESDEKGCIQIGFLPRDVAKWVAPLSDAGWFTFSAFVYPKEVLACALEGSNNKVHLILYVYKGSKFVNISNMESPARTSAMCSLVASIQRCSGLWRLHEILGHYKWPEHCETDFTFGASSVGSINAPFLAAFSAATGKRSLQLTETEESDPDWGCWSASQELRNPSMRIVFPTIERVKTSSCGLLASKYILCFTQKTWDRLRHLGILDDAVPHDPDRVGHPMHVKVGRRRFESRRGGSSIGWVYSGSHNLSAAAWGRPLQSSHDETRNKKSVLGSRLHICNYEFGIVFVVPPSESESESERREDDDSKCWNLDDITLPFVVPAPKYRSMDTPATKRAMSKAYAEHVAKQEREKAIQQPIEIEEEEEEIEDEEEEEKVLEIPDAVVEEKEDDKAYADKLWCS